MREAKKKAASRLVALAVCLLAADLLSACAREAGPHPELPFLGFSTRFSSRNLCGRGVSPAIRIVNPPPAAQSYRLRSTMVSALAGPSWESDVQATGDTIPEGAIAGYQPPCSPEFQNYAYRLELMALDSGGRPLAYGWYFVSAAPLERVVLGERQAQARRRNDPSAPDPTMPAAAPPLPLPLSSAADPTGILNSLQIQPVVPEISNYPGLLSPLDAVRPQYFVY